MGLYSGCRNVEAAVLESMRNLRNLGPLAEPDENGIMLPPGFQSRIVARSGEKPVSSSDYVWHGAPDGGATLCH